MLKDCKDTTVKFWTLWPLFGILLVFPVHSLYSLYSQFTKYVLDFVKNILINLRLLCDPNFECHILTNKKGFSKTKVLRRVT